MSPDLERAVKAMVAAYCEHAVAGPCNDEITPADYEATKAGITAALLSPSDELVEAVANTVRQTCLFEESSRLFPRDVARNALRAAALKITGRE